MAKKYKGFIPKPVAKRSDWYEFQINNIDVKGAEMGLTLTDIANYKNYCQNQIDKLKAVEKTKAAFKAAIKDYITTQKTDNPAIRALAKKMKANDGFTKARGAFLKIIDTSEVLNFDKYKPILKFQVYKTFVRLKFKFNGVENMNIYSRLLGTTAWGKPIATVQHSPFDDKTLIVVTDPVKTSEAREYMIIGVMDDKEVGLPSAIISVVFGG